MSTRDLSLAPGSNIQSSGEWAGLDHALDGHDGQKDREVVPIIEPEGHACVKEGLGLGSLGGSKICGTSGLVIPDLASLMGPILNVHPFAGPLKVGKKWKK
ncbi:hypothetical protein CsSME_00036886 [Camellia sinensis var. sinensis]